MPPKRARRASPALSGLNAGERLKRTKLTDSRVYSAWGWVGTEVNDLTHITRNHLLATCGLSPNSPHLICPNRFAISKASTPVKGSPNGAAARETDDDDVIVISDDEAPKCNAKTCKWNPYCLNHLGQEKWQDEVKARDAFMKAANLGEDPAEQSRRSSHPVGLVNLGATCYANAYLQVWFQDLPFRGGVYRCQLPEDEKFNLEASPIFQLQVTFAAMQEGNASAFNPVKLVESLKLRTTEQQDAQEFSKLFMAHLDTELQKQADPTLKTLISSQFQGSQTYVTTCQECEYRSERSSDFLEIEVTLTNNCTLEERLGALLEPEVLSEDNQYLCPRCDNLQDAERHMELSKLPPVLHFSLLRFVYDLSTMERKKSKHNISYPTVIDMDRFLGPPDATNSKRRKKGDLDSQNVYQLRGILLHKGASAYHGHYEAQVFDVQTQSWYQFNDETVTKIDSLGGSISNGAKASPKIKKTSSALSATDSKAKKSQTSQIDSDIEIVEQSPPATSEQSASDRPIYISSKDAYMLVYSRVTDGQDISASDIVERADHRVTIEPPKPPLRAKATVSALNESHASACKAFQDKKQETLAQFDQVRQRIMSIVESWNPTSRNQDCVVASRQGLELWVARRLKAQNTSKSKADSDSKDSREPSTEDNNECSSEAAAVQNERHAAACQGVGTISMSQVLCEHGQLNPSKAGDMKLITGAAHWRIATEDMCEFVPVVRPSDICEYCVAAIFEEKLYQVEHPHLVEQFDDISSVEEDEPGFWISKQWLKDWRLAKPKMHAASRPDPPPDAPDYKQDVQCEHGGLSANITARRRISSEARSLLKQTFPSWDPLSTDAEMCPVCEALLHISKGDKREFRKRAEEEKAKLKHMHDNALNGNTMLLENVPCAIVPAQFVRAWRQWILRPTEVSRPDRVDTSQFLCEHGLLALDPNDNIDMDSSVVAVKYTDWERIQELYSGGPEITVVNTGPRFVHDLAVCASCRLKRKSTFDITEITIRILGPGTPTPSPESYSEEQAAGRVVEHTGPPALITYGSKKTSGLRQSKRIQEGRAKRGKRRRVTITNDMSVKDLKVMLHDELRIPVISQRLFCRGTELLDSASSLTSLGISTNDVLDLQEQSEDITLLSDSDVEPDVRRKGRREGQGFGGTLLSGLLTSEVGPQTGSRQDKPTTRACPACTFVNDISAVACSICETRF